MKISECISEFIIDQRVKGNSHLTVSYYERSLKLFVGFLGDISVDELSLLKCKQFVLYLQNDGSKNSALITSDTLKDLFRKLKKKTGISRLHAHLLRHTFATMYLNNGGNIYTLQTILGHTSLEMVKKYLHIAPYVVVNDFFKYSPIDKKSPG